MNYHYFTTHAAALAALNELKLAGKSGYLLKFSATTWEVREW